MEVLKKDLMGAVGLLLEKDLKRLLEIIQYSQSLWLLKCPFKMFSGGRSRSKMWPVVRCMSLKYKGENYKVQPKELTWAPVKAKEGAGGKETWSCRDTRYFNNLDGIAEWAREREGTRSTLKEQRSVTTENFDNEQLDKGRLGIYIQFSFSAKEEISDVQTCSVLLVRKKCHVDASLNIKKGKVVKTKAAYKAVFTQR